MSHVKGAGTTKLGRDSASKRLGVKISDGQPVKAGNVIIRQRGIKYRPGMHVARGADDTISAVADGVVKFGRKKITTFTGKRKEAVFVNVKPA